MIRMGCRRRIDMFNKENAGGFGDSDICGDLDLSFEKYQIQHSNI